MHALITGANGFIGAHLVEQLLARGHDVTCMVRVTSNTDALADKRVRRLHGDVTDPATLPAAIAGADIVFHLAGRAFARDLEEFFRVNQVGLRNVLAASAARSTPPTVIFVSSLAALGPAPPDRLLTEEDTPRPVSDYGRSKLAGEMEARLFADRVPVTIVRPGIVFGPRDRQSLELFRPVRRFRIYLIPGYAPARLSLIHVHDLCELLVAAGMRGGRLRGDTVRMEDVPGQTAPLGEAMSPALRAESSRGIYLAASDETPTFAEIGRMIASGVRRPYALMLPVPKALARAAGEAAELFKNVSGRSFPFGRDKAREATAGSWACSIRRAKEDLGFQPAAPLVDRIHQTAQWYLEHRWLY